MTIDKRIEEAREFIRQNGSELFRHNYALIEDAKNWYKENETDFKGIGYNEPDGRFMVEVYLPQFHWEKKK